MTELPRKVMNVDNINVLKRDGSVAPFDIEKIHKMVELACKNITGVSVSDIEMEAHLSFYDGIGTADIHHALIYAAANLISEQAPNYQYVAGRLLMFDIRKTAWGGMKPPRLYDHIVQKIEEEYYTPELLELYSEEDWDKLDNVIDHDRDLKMSHIAVKEYLTKYAIRDRSADKIVPQETPQLTYILIAALMCSDTCNIKDVKSYYNDVSLGNFSLPTPIMSGMRSLTKQFSSCFPAGQVVWTNKGYKNIEDIKVNDKVLTRSGNYHSVLATNNKTTDEDIYTFNGPFFIPETFKCTASHKIFGIKKFNEKTKARKKYSSPDWYECKDLEHGDFVQIPFNKDINPRENIYVSDFIDLEEIGYKINDEGLIRKKTTDKANRSGDYDDKCKGVYNQIPLTKELFRLFGYYLAEGYCGKDVVAFTLGTHEKETFIKDIIDICKNTFSELHVSVSPNSSDNSTKICLQSIPLAAFFKSILGTGFDTKFIDDFLMKAPYELQEELLIGVIRGDGCVHKMGMTLSLSNKNLVTQIAYIMLRVGLYPCLNKREPSGKPAGIKQITTMNTTYVITMGVSGNYDFLVKVDKGEQSFTKPKVPTTYSKYMNGEYYSKIWKIKNLGKYNDLVYDIQVDNDQSFTVSGAGVHNCVLIESDDRLKSISETNTAIQTYVAKKAGIGIGMSGIRAEGAPVANRTIKHTGVIPYFRQAQGTVKSCCLRPDMFVEIAIDEYMKTKKIRLSELKSGDKIKTYDPISNEIVFKKVTDVWDTVVTEKDQCLVILANGCEIECSINHPFMVLDGEDVIERKPDSLRIADIVITDTGTTAVTNILFGRQNQTNYIDVTVENTHTFFTSNQIDGEMVLTHNSQGGVRGGAATVHVLLWHPEIENILVLKNNKGTQDNRVRQLDYSVIINNFLYKKMMNGGDIKLFSPHDVPDLYEAYFSNQPEFEKLYKKYEKDESLVKGVLKARTLFSTMMIERKGTGRIYIMNIDNVNNHSSFIDPVRMSNLCQEITLITVPMGTTESYEIYVPNDKLLSTLNELGESDLVSKFEILGVE